MEHHVLILGTRTLEPLASSMKNRASARYVRTCNMTYEPGIRLTELSMRSRYLDLGAELNSQTIEANFIH